MAQSIINTPHIRASPSQPERRGRSQVDATCAPRAHNLANPARIRRKKFPPQPPPPKPLTNIFAKLCAHKLGANPLYRQEGALRYDQIPKKLRGPSPLRDFVFPSSVAEGEKRCVEFPQKPHTQAQKPHICKNTTAKTQRFLQKLQILRAKPHILPARPPHLSFSLCHGSFTSPPSRPV
jgi:hypothetical protein